MDEYPDANNERDMLHQQYIKAVETRDAEQVAPLAVALGISDKTVAQHLAVAHHADTEWQPDNFEEFDALPPGRFDPRVFDQTVWWIDALRQPHRIADRETFSDAYLKSVIGFVRNEGWRWVDSFEFNDEPITADSVRTAIRQSLEATPLMQTLLQEATKRNIAVNL